MNLFVFGFGMSHDLKKRIPDALHSMCDVFPYLDFDTFYDSGDSAYVAGIHSDSGVIKPRCYVHQSGNETILFDGVPIDTSGKFQASDAKQLARHWSTLPDILEGQFCVAHMRSNPDSIEVMVDALGMYQLYYSKTQNGVFLSNSVELINRINVNYGLDVLGAAYLLGLGWVTGDRTLREGVRVIPPGEIWRWEKGCLEPKRKTYFQLSDYSRAPKKDFSAYEARDLAEELSCICRGLSVYQGVVKCPITAGRDSRVLTALLTHNSLIAEYFSSGPVSSPDVMVGSNIAKALNLHHRAGDKEILGDDAILSQWGTASQRLLRQTDGMVTLAYIGNAMGHPKQIEHINVHLYGVAGEIARPFFLKNNIPYYLFEHRPAYFTEYIINSLITPNKEMLRADVVQSASNYVRDFTRDATDMGFAAKDLDAVFYTRERARRWGGGNFRQVSSCVDVFSPLATRPYVKAAFGVPAWQRYSERIPKELLHYLVPELDEIPFEIPWHSQTAYGLAREHLLWRAGRSIPVRAIQKLYRVATGTKYKSKFTNTKANQHARLLEARLDDFRSLCLDQSNSLLWDLVDRKKLENILSASTDAQQRRRRLNVLYDIFTLFQYSSLDQSNPRLSPPV
jgi:asparagine synthase (glutamine-hydrolysing)